MRLVAYPDRRMKVMEPPVFSGESPSSCITARNCALMSKSPDSLDVLLVMMIPFNVVGLFGCVSSMPRFCNPLAGSLFSGRLAELSGCRAFLRLSRPERRSCSVRAHRVVRQETRSAFSLSVFSFSSAQRSGSLSVPINPPISSADVVWPNHPQLPSGISITKEYGRPVRMCGNRRRP